MKGKITIFLLLLTQWAWAQLDFTYSTTVECAREDYEFTASGVTASKIRWNFDDGTDSVQVAAPYTVVHRFSRAGVYAVTLEELDASDNVVNSVTKNVTVYDKPNLNLEYHAPSIVCAEQDTVILVINSVDLEDPQLQMTIDWGDGSSTSATYNDLGNQIVHVYKKTSCGNKVDINGIEVSDRFLLMVTETNRCTDIPEIDFQTVDIKSKPNSLFKFDLNVYFDTTDSIYYVCELGEQVIKNTAYGTDNCMGVSDVVWTVYNDAGDEVGDCVGCLDTFVYNFDQYGVYTIKLEQSNACGVAEIKKQVNVRQPSDVSMSIREPAFCYPVKLTFDNTSSDNNLYYWWEFTGDTIYEFIDTGKVDPPHTYDFTEEGTYTIVLKGFDGYCYNDADTTLELLNRCQDIYVPNAFIPSDPDPAIRVFKPMAQDLVEYKIEIYDLNGKLLWSSTEITDTGEPAEAWDGTYKGEPCPQGTYIWKVYAVIDEGEFGQREWDGQVYNSKKKRSVAGTVLLIR